MERGREGERGLMLIFLVLGSDEVGESFCEFSDST